MPSAPPSKTQRQADMMQHAAHDGEYASSRGVPQDVAQEFHQMDVRQALHGKYKGCPCPKCEEEKGK